MSLHHYTYCGASITVRHWSGFYQCIIVMSDGTRQYTAQYATALEARTMAETKVDAWRMR